jgi:hypothetical protein
MRVLDRNYRLSLYCVFDWFNLPWAYGACYFGSLKSRWTKGQVERTTALPCGGDNTAGA